MVRVLWVVLYIGCDIGVHCVDINWHGLCCMLLCACVVVAVIVTKLYVDVSTHYAGYCMVVCHIVMLCIIWCWFVMCRCALYMIMVCCIIWHCIVVCYIVSP